MKKYCALRAEIRLHIGFYKAHVRNFQLLAGGLLTAGAYILANNVALTPSNDTWLIWCIGLFVLSLTANYLFLDVIDPQYAILTLADRLGTIEHELNRTAGRRILVWESGAAAKAYSGSFPYPKVLNPNIMIAICGMSLFFIMALAIPGYGYLMVYKNYTSATSVMILPIVIGGIFVSLALTAGTTYSIFSVLLLMRGEPRAYFEKLLAEPLQKTTPSVAGHSRL